MLVTLIAVLSCLALQRFLQIKIRVGDRFIKLLTQVSRRLPQVDRRVLAIGLIGVTWLLFWILHLAFHKVFLGLFDLFFATVVLFFTIDFRDLRLLLEDYFTESAAQDFTAAAQTMRSFITVPQDAQSLSRAVSEFILETSFYKIFVGIFWFIIGGIYGVSAYTLIIKLMDWASQLGEQKFTSFLLKIRQICEWLPARLVGFSYALVGRFSQVSEYCLKYWRSGVDANRYFVVDAGLAALDLVGQSADLGNEENFAILDLIDRVIVVWIVVIALIMIGVLI